MRVFFACTAMILATASCGGGDGNESAAQAIANARPANLPGVSLQLCGGVASYVPATDSAEGALAIDQTPFRIAVGVHIDGDELLVRAAAVCIDATLDSDEKITACSVTAKAPGDPWALVTNPD